MRIILHFLILSNVITCPDRQRVKPKMIILEKSELTDLQEVTSELPYRFEEFNTGAGIRLHLTL